MADLRSGFVQPEKQTYFFEPWIANSSIPEPWVANSPTSQTGTAINKSNNTVYLSPQVEDYFNSIRTPTTNQYIIDDILGDSPISRALREPTPNSDNIFTNAVNPQVLSSGPIIGNMSLQDGYIKSGNFVTGNTGWKIDALGNAEFSNGTFRGTFNIGGTSITIDNTKNIQTYLDTISTAGGGTLFLQAGTYTLTANISIPSNVSLVGVARDSVTINCNTSYAVSIAGTNTYSTGTVTINNGDTTLVGSGTTWTSAMVGRYAFLDGEWYEITAFTDTTHVTIATYEGTNLAGASYVFASTNFNSSLREVTVTGATGSGIIIQYSQESILSNVNVNGCGTGVNMDYVVFPKLEMSATGNGVNLDMNYVNGFLLNFCEFSRSTTGAGIVMTNSGNANVYSTSINDNFGDGVNATSMTRTPFIGCDISGNGGDGIEFVSGCDDNQIAECMLQSNTSNGIKLTAASDRNTITAVSLKSNGTYGMTIAASTCDNNVLIGVIASGNVSGSLSDSGTGTLKSTTVNVLP